MWSNERFSRMTMIMVSKRRRSVTTATCHPLQLLRQHLLLLVHLANDVERAVPKSCPSRGHRPKHERHADLRPAITWQFEYGLDLRVGEKGKNTAYGDRDDLNDRFPYLLSLPGGLLQREPIDEPFDDFCDAFRGDAQTSDERDPCCQCVHQVRHSDPPRGTRTLRARHTAAAIP